MPTRSLNPGVTRRVLERGGYVCWICKGVGADTADDMASLDGVLA